MYAEIITIGDEILIGQIVDTNSAFIGKALNSIGISVYQITSVQDDKTHILKALASAEKNAEVIIITGGLGPTKDDITKHTITAYFNDTLVQNDAVLAHVEHLFKTYISSSPISDLNRKQALVPSKAEVLMNKYGTAPGMWLEKGEKTFISLPGVPYEMKSLIETKILSKLAEKYKRPYILHRTLLTYGLGESSLSERIEKWEDALPDYIKLAYLPSLGRVRIRLSAKGFDEHLIKDEVERQIQTLLPQINDIFVGFEEEQHSIEQIIANQLTQLGLTLAIAESCTGGKLTERFTANPGTSSYFKGATVTYATQSKIDVLGVPEENLKNYSVVSKQVAEAMAIRVSHIFHSDIGIATTGHAGPTKGEGEGEIGTVFIAIAIKDKVFSERFTMGNHRTRVINKTVNKALELLQKKIFEN